MSILKKTGTLGKNCFASIVFLVMFEIFSLITFYVYVFFHLSLSKLNLRIYEDFAGSLNQLNFCLFYILIRQIWLSTLVGDVECARLLFTAGATGPVSGAAAGAGTSKNIPDINATNKVEWERNEGKTRAPRGTTMYNFPAFKGN